MNKTSVKIGFCAGFGGTAPNLFRLATGMTKGEGMPELTYLVGMMLFACIGAATALAFGETDTRKALFLGLGLPAMFQSAAQDVSAATIQSSLFLPVAYASEEPPQRKVYVQWRGEVEPADFSLIYSFEDDTRRVKDDFPRTSDEYHHTSPPDATMVQALVGDVKTGPRSNWVKLPGGNAPLRFVLTVDGKAFSGFKQAVGIRDAADMEVSLEVSVEQANKED